MSSIPQEATDKSYLATDIGMRRNVRCETKFHAVKDCAMCGRLACTHDTREDTAAAAATAIGYVLVAALGGAGARSRVLITDARITAAA